MEKCAQLRQSGRLKQRDIQKLQAATLGGMPDDSGDRGKRLHCIHARVTTKKS
jgi:hypothetical protein